MCGGKSESLPRSTAAVDRVPTAIAAIFFCEYGNTLKWATGSPMAQQVESKSIRRTKDVPELKIDERSSRAARPRRDADDRTARPSRAANATPNEAKAAFCSPDSAAPCLNFASRQTNRGSASSLKRDDGSKPSFRASENLNSARAEGDTSASCVHHRGQAASSAKSLNPILTRRERSCRASSRSLMSAPALLRCVIESWDSTASGAVVLQSRNDFQRAGCNAICP